MCTELLNYTIAIPCQNSNLKGTHPDLSDCMKRSIRIFLDVDTLSNYQFYFDKHQLKIQKVSF